MAPLSLPRHPPRTAAPIFQPVSRTSSGNAVDDHWQPLTTDSSSLLVYREGSRGGGASFCLCYARDSHPLAPFVQPSLPLPLDHKSFHDRKSRGAPISSARAMASSFLSQHVQVPGLFSFSARYPSFNDLGPTRLPREWRLSGSANDLVSSTTKCGNFWTDRSSRERLS